MQMNDLIKDSIFITRTHWLILHRWITIAIVCVFTFIGGRWLGMNINEFGLYLSALTLIIINLVSISLKKSIISQSESLINKKLKMLLNFQITTDLLVLTVMIHFSGGIENPLFAFYVFHPVNASLFLSVIETYLQTILVIIFFTVMALLEYAGFIPHYSLSYHNFFNISYYDNLYSVFLIVGFFTLTMLMLAYLSTTIGKRLRNQEKSLRDAINKLNEQNTIKNEYVVEVTHEVKGHLTAVLSCLEVVINTGETIDKSEKQFLLSRAYHRSKHLSDFVKSLLKLTRMRMEQKLEMDWFPIKDIMSEIINSQRLIARDKSIKLIFNDDIDLNIFYGNRLMIEESINNLINNAIKYTQPNGEVTVGCSKDGNFIVIKVKDTGIGIPENDLKRVFDEFYRASNVAKNTETGTGMGLSIVKQIVERHHGEITATSTMGEGTEFIMKLPYKN
jgi:signal transduction histidine kinase